MKNWLFATVAAVGTVSLAAPASAAVIISFGNVTTDENVLFASSTTAPNTSVVAETNQSEFDVTFTNSLGLLADASGQSSIRNPIATATPGGNLFGTTDVSLESGVSFRTAEFNLPGIPGNATPEADFAIVTAFLLGGGSFTTTVPGLALGGNGENRIGISGTAGELFTWFRVQLNPAGGGVGSMTQVRLGGVSAVTAVPEPAAWAMLIFGFGMMGGAVRRRASLKLSYA